ncbi:hypothetical protein N7475_004169 [Penicillium sp. IBT 31633x]|nr:hypothetical protein N7475_004169 [Penicillium sp. IBT 31633x]
MAERLHALTTNTSGLASSLQQSTPDMAATNNFGEVVLGIHRSAFPDVESYAQHLSGIKTIEHGVLVDSPYDKPEEDFIQSTGIQVYLFPLPANKIAGTKANMQELSATVNEVLAKLLDAENHPILIHYYQGKAIPDIIDEYRQSVGKNARPLDEVFIQQYESGDILREAQEVNVASWTQPSKTRLESSSQPDNNT